MAAEGFIDLVWAHTICPTEKAQDNRPGSRESNRFDYLPVKSLGALTETAGKTIVNKGTLQHILEGLLNGHLTTSSRGIGGHLDFNSGISFCRHFCYMG